MVGWVKVHLQPAICISWIWIHSNGYQTKRQVTRLVPAICIRLMATNLAFSCLGEVMAATTWMIFMSSTLSNSSGIKFKLLASHLHQGPTIAHQWLAKTCLSLEDGMVRRDWMICLLLILSRECGHTSWSKVSHQPQEQACLYAKSDRSYICLVGQVLTLSALMICIRLILRRQGGPTATTSLMWSRILRCVLATPWL